MAQIDMNNKSKKIEISTRKPLDGIEFSKREEPNWIKASSQLSKEITKAQHHAEYCQLNFNEAERKLNVATDPIQKLKLKQDMDYWKNQLKEARSQLANISRELSTFHKKSR